MSQGGAWSRMMSDEIEIDDIGILPNQPSAPKKKAIRVANYSLDEDIQLCESWKNITMDPITENEQPGKAYWKRIHDNFHANRKFASDRNANSLEHRWATIHKECQKFQGLFDDVERRHPSGVPYQEHLLEAQNAYASKDPKKKAFAFLHCWLKIRHSEKFVSPVTNKRSREDNSPPGTMDVVDVEDEGGKSQTPDSSMPSSKRPMGRKQAKEKLKKGGEQCVNYNLIEKFLAEKEKVREDRWFENKMMHERKISLEERKIANKEKKRQWEQEQQIMFCDLEKLDPSQKTYVIAMRAHIAAQKMAAFNNAFDGSSGHEASGGGEI